VNEEKLLKGVLMIDSQVVAFFGVALIITLTPGADTMLVIRNVLAYGRTAGLFTVIGIVSGLFVHASFSALGLSVILMRSAEVFEIVKLIGAGYLILLGLQSVRALLKQQDQGSGSSPDYRVEAQPNKWQSYVQGLLNNLLNPKVAIFYLAFLPQFMRPGDPVFAKSILLAVIHLFQGVIWLSIVVLLVAYMKTVLLRPRIQQVLEALSGVILIGLGIRLATERR
jgi:RhtB (resistance to homoserine/threonine) family protein